MATIPIVEKLTGGWRTPDRPVILVPGHDCFGIAAPLPPGTLENEHAAIATLAIEQASPFPIEHLATGHVVPPAGDGLVATAVYRRKVSPAALESWKDAYAVLPDYASFLCGCRDAAGTVVILETKSSVTGIDFPAGSRRPQRIVSRGIADSDESDSSKQARDQVLSKIPAGGRPMHRYRLADEPALQHGSRLRFNWNPVGGAPAVTCEMTDRAMWAQDLRDSDESRSRRKAATLDRAVVRIGIGLVLVPVLLLIGEVLMIFGGIWIAGREGVLAGGAPAVQQIESDFEVANRLDAYGASKPVPLELLAYVNDMRPRSIYFTRTSFDSPAQMTIDAATGNLADVNEYEAALRRAPGLALVETRNTKAREGGATFQLILAFRPGFNPATVAAPGPASAPADVQVQP